MFRLTPYNNRQVTKKDGRNYNDFYSIIDSFFDDSFWDGRNLQKDTFKVDIKDEEDHYLIQADLPGVEKKEVNLQFEKDTLTISVERKEEENTENNNFIHRERRVTSMMRSMQLKGIDENSIDAKLDNGVLTVKAQKMQETKIQKYIEIK